jgi:hypothetical protein
MNSDSAQELLVRMLGKKLFVVLWAQMLASNSRPCCASISNI